MNQIKTLQTLVKQVADKTLDEDAIRLWQPIGQQSNQVYRIQFDGHDWVAKIFLKPAEFDDAPRREFATMKLLTALDIAPQPIHYEPHGQHDNPIVIYEFMPGAMWDRQKPSAGDLETLAQLWLTLHRVPVEDLWLSRGMERTGDQIGEQFASRFAAYETWAAVNFPEGLNASRYLASLARTGSDLLKSLFALTPELCFSRADPRFANVIARPNHKLGMIDWEDSGLRDAARDMSDMVMHPNQEDLLTQDEWQAFFVPYLQEQRQTDPNLEKRIHQYHGIFPLFWLSGLLTHGISRWQNGKLTGWTINEMNPNQRLRRYLARALAYPSLDYADKLTEIEGMRFFDLG